MRKIELYTSPACGFCHAAKRLLDRKGAEFDEFDVSRSPEKRREMMDRTNGRSSVPQIFVGDVHVGGFDDLSELERAGKLDPLLGG